MGRFKHLVATGVRTHRQRARQYERWSRMLLREYGPPLSPHIIDVRKWSVAFLKKTL